MKKTLSKSLKNITERLRPKINPAVAVIVVVAEIQQPTNKLQKALVIPIRR